MNRFVDKVALVTGGSAGIGAACAQRLAAEGCVVVISDVSDDAGNRIAEAINDAGGQAQYLRADVSDPADWRNLAAVIQSQHGHLDVLVSNAFTLVEGSAAELSLENWNRQLAVNLTGLFLAIKTFGAELSARTGSLVAVSSVHALFGMAGRPAYAASKGGITALVRQLAVEYGPAVRVNAVLPGPIHTGVWDGVEQAVIQQAADATILRRMGQATEVAAAITFLASADASFITGVSLLVDGGWAIFKDSP